MVDTESIKTKVEIEIEDAERSLDEMETTMGDYGGEMEAQQQSYQGELEKTGASWLEIGAIAGGTLYGIAKLSPLMGGFMSTWKDQLGAVADLWFVTNSEGLAGITMMFSDATAKYSEWKNDLSEGESEVAEYLTNPFLYWTGKYDDVKEHFDNPGNDPYAGLTLNGKTFEKEVDEIWGTNGFQGSVDKMDFAGVKAKWISARDTLSEWGAETPDELFDDLGVIADDVMGGIKTGWESVLDFISEKKEGFTDVMATALPGNVAGPTLPGAPILPDISNNSSTTNVYVYAQGLVDEHGPPAPSTTGRSWEDKLAAEIARYA